MGRFRPRISLLNAMLLLTVLGLGITVYQLGKEVVPLRAENKRLNEERGTLYFEDANKVHAIRVPDRFAGNQGTFRVFVPEGQTYVAIVAVNDIPKDRIPEVARREDAGRMTLGQAGANGFAKLSPGEHQISLTLRHPQSGSPRVVFNSDSHTLHDAFAVSISVSKAHWTKRDWPLYHNFDSGVYATTETVDAGQPLVLMRHRRMASSPDSISVSYRVPEPDHPLDGMMLWIEPL